MKKSIPFVCLLLIILTLLLVIIINNDSGSDITPNGVVYDPNLNVNQSQVGTKLPGIAIPGWTTIKLPSNTLEAEVSLHNPQTNADYYDLTFELKFKDSQETIFTTGYIEPGYKCNKVTLSRKLKKGEYDAILVVQPYIKDFSKTPTNNAKLDVKLIVE